MKNKSIKYYSTNGNSPEVSFGDALLKGLAPDGGLYLPDALPLLSTDELKKFSDNEYYETAFHVLNNLIGSEINETDLISICRDAYRFEVPLEMVTERKFIMRLDRGPTASFKDFAARMMSRLMQYFSAMNNEHLTILTATSGDTGSAVASAFHGLGNISVIILYPRDEVTPMQRKQMTTLHGNVNVIAVDGKFDDCQKLVKQAFMDPLLSHIRLSSANSINIGRLLPQSVYYFHAWAKLSGSTSDKVIFSVPSGNFGNLMGGLIALKMGLPVKKFVISTNDNNEVPEFLHTGIYESITPSINCISSAMNVGHPSNLARIVAIYGGSMDENGLIKHKPDFNKMSEELFGLSINENETRLALAEVYNNYKIMLEPHGAVAWAGLDKFIKSQGDEGTDNQLYIALETAHPAKFPEEIRKIINQEPALPLSLSGLNDKDEKYTVLENSYSIIRDYILNNC